MLLGNGGGRLGGPIFNIDYYVDKAVRLTQMGADSICLKDMAGLMAPYDAFDLVTALKSEVDVPLQLHTHYTSGMASMTALKAIDAGIDVVDACLAPLALRTSQPAVEPLVVSLSGTERDCGLDLNELLPLGDYLESVLPKYREHLESPRVAVIDARVLSHQIPGGMVSNLVSQLREAGAIDRMAEVLEEIPRARKELGQPPLVTPISQMVGTQAVSNVLFGRYKMVSEQVKDYVYGLYGASPARPDPELTRTILKDYQRGQEPITTNPSDLLDPELDAAREAVRDISSDIEDVLTYALYPTTGMRFLRIKHGLDPVPDEMKPPAPRRGFGGSTPCRRARRRQTRGGASRTQRQHEALQRIRRRRVLRGGRRSGRPVASYGDRAAGTAAGCRVAPADGPVAGHPVSGRARGVRADAGRPAQVPGRGGPSRGGGRSDCGPGGDEDGEHPTVAGGRDGQSSAVGAGRHGQAGSGPGRHLPITVLVRRRRCWAPDGATPTLGMS